jgi:ABC-2 type transport system permease protein
MRLLLLLVAKDLRRKLRSPLGLIGALAFPVVFAGMIALAFGKDGGVPKVRMLVVDEDGSLLASGLASAFGSRQAASVFAGRTVSEAGGRELMENGKADALLTIPRGFGRDVLEARPVALRLVRNPSEGILPEIAEQTVGALADILDGGRRLLDRPMQTLRPLLDDRAAAPADADVAAVSLAFKRAIEGASKLVLPPAITLESDLFATSAGGSPSGGRASAKPSGSSLSAIFLAVFPGVAVYGLFMVADQGMRDVMTERTLGTLRRQLAGPVRAEAVIAAKAAYTAIVAAGALIVLALVVVAFVRASVSVPGFALLSSALVVAVTGTTSMVYGLARTEREASTLGNMLFVAMGFLGGGFIRIEGLPAAVRHVAPVTPLYWGVQGYRALLESGASVAGVARPAAILAAMGVAFLAVGMAALRRAARTGASA